MFSHSTPCPPEPIYETYRDHDNGLYAVATTHPSSGLVFELLPVMRNRREAAGQVPSAAATTNGSTAAAAAVTTESTATATPTLVIKSGAASDAAPITLLKPDRPLLGVNGTGQLRRPLLAGAAAAAAAPGTTVRPTLVSEPISSDDQPSEHLYEMVDVPDNDTTAQAEAKKHNYTIQYKDVSRFAEPVRNRIHQFCRPICNVCGCCCTVSVLQLIHVRESGGVDGISEEHPEHAEEWAPVAVPSAGYRK